MTIVRSIIIPPRRDGSKSFFLGGWETRKRGRPKDAPLKHGPLTLDDKLDEWRHPVLARR